MSSAGTVLPDVVADGLPTAGDLLDRVGMKAGSSQTHRRAGVRTPQWSEPLFCEDSARRVAAALASDLRVRAHRVHVEHQESLHAHDAVAAVASLRRSVRAAESPS